MNFLSNALKFTDKHSRITVLVKVLESQVTKEIDAENTEMYISLQLSILDTGVGISQEGLSNLFIDFGKLEEGSSRNRQGTGLGLSICKNIIERMGGSVSVKSTLGKGTEFKVIFKTKCRVTPDYFE